MNFEDLLISLASFPFDKIVFVGLGSEICGDDSAGLVLLDMLKKRDEFKNSHFVIGGITPENHLAEMTKISATVCVFIDTVRHGNTPGDIALVDPSQVSRKGFSTHTFSIKMIEDFLKAHGYMQFLYIGIEPKSTAVGTLLSPEVQDGLSRFFLIQDQEYDR